MGGKPKPFKLLVNRHLIGTIADAVAGAHPSFDRDQFVRRAARGLGALEIRARVDQIIAALHATLPSSFPDAVEVLLDAMSSTDLRGFSAWPIVDYVGAHGVEHPVVALAALRRLTARFSAEFAIRPFLELHEEKVLAELAVWVRDSDEHVRRLVSEGTRPRLPWGRRLRGFQQDPKPVIKLLGDLKDDPSEYVRRSVANNLNDIAKDHPVRVVEVAERWVKGGGANRQRLIRHALRTLVKQGDSRALAVLGFADDGQFSVGPILLSRKQVAVGQVVEFEFSVISTSKNDQRLSIDYAVHYLKKNGTHSPRVFKLKSATLAAGTRQGIRKRHSFEPVSIRTLYPGVHRIEILINGRSSASAELVLRA